jgi:hypothetical protein
LLSGSSLLPRQRLTDSNSRNDRRAIGFNDRPFDIDNPLNLGAMNHD